MVDWNDVLNESVLALMKIILPILVTMILKWLLQAWATLKAEKPSLASMIEECAMIGYHAAEDYFHDVKDANGEDKMNYAVAIAGDYLTKVFGETAPEEILHSAISTYGSDTGLFSWTEGGDHEEEHSVMGFVQ